MAETDASIAEILRDYVPRADYEAALESLNETITERDTGRTGSETATKRIAELEKIVRGNASRAAFDKAADKLKIDPKFRDAAYKLSELPADKDEPDQAAVEKHLTEYLKGDGQHFITPAETKPTKLPKGESSDRGSPTKPGEPEYRVTKKNLRDAVFMRDNQRKVSEASNLGLLVIDDD